MHSAAGWASVAVAALALGWAVTTWLLGRALRRAGTQAVTEHRLADLAEAQQQMAANAQQQLQLLRTEVREDRQATNRRLRYLEEHLWTHTPRAS